MESEGKLICLEILELIYEIKIGVLLNFLVMVVVDIV